MIPSPLSSPSSATADARLASNVGHGPSADVNPLITELKTRARLRLKALTAAAAPKAPAADEAAGRRDGVVARDPVRVARTLVSAISGYLTQELMGGGIDEIDVQAQEAFIVDVLMRSREAW